MNSFRVRALVLRTVKVALAILVALLIGASINLPSWVATLGAKAFGKKAPCPWSQLLVAPWAGHRFQRLQKSAQTEFSVEASDDVLGIELIRTRHRAFWIKKAGSQMDGPALLAFLMAEQEWLSSYAGDLGVRKGDVVVDVGAHIGTFGDEALRRGASKVIMIEPDPINAECIRRNFAAEIKDKTVVLIPEGAWSGPGAVRFHVGARNSGTGSFVRDEGNETEMVLPVRALDDILRSVGSPKVQFIKMDIEGAEREALKGASLTLALYQPRLLLDMYHLPDDNYVLPSIISKANAKYHSTCLVCAETGDQAKAGILPYATMFY
jgi:FkbM family methyltransferase